MKEIHSHAIYTSDELNDLIKGFVKITTLRKHGLVGSPGSGYWGNNIIDSIENYWQYLSRQRKGEMADMEDHQNENTQVFENKKQKVQNGKLHSSSRTKPAMESEWERFERQL
jgi:hypothetical protein